MVGEGALPELADADAFDIRAFLGGYDLPFITVQEVAKSRVLGFRAGDKNPCVHVALNGRSPPQRLRFHVESAVLPLVPFLDC